MRLKFVFDLVSSVVLMSDCCFQVDFANSNHLRIELNCNFYPQSGSMQIPRLWYSRWAFSYSVDFAQANLSHLMNEWLLADFLEQLFQLHGKFMPQLWLLRSIQAVQQIKPYALSARAAQSAGRPVTGAPFCEIMKWIEFSCIPCITDCIQIHH